MSLLRVFFVCLIFCGCVQNLVASELGVRLQSIEKQTRWLLINTQKASLQAPSWSKYRDTSIHKLVTPRSIEDNGELRLVPSSDWCSGFFPGNLWFVYELTGKNKWKQEAEKYTLKIEPEKTNGTTHDMGFKMLCSFGNAYRLTKGENYKQVLIQSAYTLATRFNPRTGCIVSWDHSRDKWVNPVIIDNMMNLELLFYAFNHTGDSLFYKIAASHATATMKNHFRSDYSSYHVVDYDPVTGIVLQKTTHQGLSDESAWARGQAWALYGYVMMYRETKNVQYLRFSEKIADYILNHPNLPTDKVPYYDFDAPAGHTTPRDASAAALIASALYELSTYGTSKTEEYRTSADSILSSLNSVYVSDYRSNNGFLLGHSTGSHPQNSEVDVPLIYADYYYLEALVRKKKLQKKQLLEFNTN